MGDLAVLLREAREELDAWRRYAQVRGMGAFKTHQVLIARIDEALAADENDCHICHRPKDGVGELFCSYPHPLVAE